MRKKITLSILVIGSVALLIFGVTQAFFSDTETSVGNTLEAGSLDLKVDNTCYYNGQACIEGNWGGGSEEGEECSCSWASTDLTNELFFDLHDLKPGDWEEDTISFDVENPAWLCGEAVIRANDDVTCTEPEDDDEAGACEEPGNELGELADALNFVFWVDDGDNVFEADETEGVIRRGSASSVFGGQEKWLKGDSTGSFGPIGPETFYIGKYFCYGNIEEVPVAEGDGTPLDRSTGFTCDGKLVDNQTQTDNLIVDFSFYAEQSRHNEDFSCTGERPSITPSPSITVTPTPVSCGNADVMLVLDRSGSISSGELTLLKTAANSFVDTLALSASGNHAGKSSFATTGNLNHQLTDDPVSLKAAINAMVSDGFTNLKEGIDLAAGELASVRDRNDATSPDKMVIITDGNPNRPLPSTTADDVAKTSADAARAAGSEIFVVGIGSDVNASYLQTIADDAGHYYSSADYAGLDAILDNLDLCD